jgi:hypothetical protein
VEDEPLYETAEVAALAEVDSSDGTPLVLTSAGSPDGRVRAVLVRDSRLSMQALPWVVWVRREAAGWVWLGQARAAAPWVSLSDDDEPNRGARAVYGRAPEEATQAHLDVRGDVATVPVVAGWYLHCEWDVPPPTEDGRAAEVRSFS